MNQNLLVLSTPLKNISQLGSFPQVGVKIKNIPNHQPEKKIVGVSKNRGNPKMDDIYWKALLNVDDVGGFYPPFSDLKLVQKPAALVN